MMEMSTPETSRRQSVRNSEDRKRKDRDVLEKICIFCKKDKYLKVAKTRANLSMCMQLRADERIRRASEMRQDMKMIALTGDELIAKEAHYHASCYRLYTRIMYQQDKTGENFDYAVDESEEAFELVKEKLKYLYEQPDIIEFTTICDVYESDLHQKSIDNKSITSLKKNLRRKIMNNLVGFNFIDVNRRYFVYPETLKIDNVVVRFLELKNEIDSIMRLKDVEKNILNTTITLRNEIQNLNSEMSWPPQASELSVERLVLPIRLDFFLDNLLRGMKTREDSNRVDRLKISSMQYQNQKLKLRKVFYILI